MVENWTKNYDHLSVSEIIIDLASLQSRKRKKIPLQKTYEVLDVMVDRATATEGLRHPGEGEFFFALGKLTGIKEYRIHEQYKSEGIITNQFDKLVKSISFIERFQSNYFTLNNLTNTFGDEDGRFIHSKVSQIKNPSDNKGKMNDFAQRSVSQTCSLEMLVLDKTQNATKSGLPLMAFLKKGKDADSFTRKIAKYITEKIPFIETTIVGKMDSFFPIAMYLHNPKEFKNDNNHMKYFSKISDEDLNNFLKTYASWEATNKNFILARERLAHLENNPVRSFKNCKESNAYQAELGKNRLALRENSELKDKARAKVIAIYEEIKPFIKESIKEHSTLENELFMEEMFCKLGNIKDLRGIGLVLASVPKNYESKMINNAKYIKGSFEDHGNKKRDRNSDYEGLHAQFRARRFEGDEERDKFYSFSEQLEVQVNSLDNYVKSVFGKFNHTNYHHIREEQTFENFSDEQKIFYKNLVTRLNSINASQISDDEHSLEKVFGRLYDVKTNKRKSLSEYDSKLLEETKMLNDKWNEMR